MSQRPLTPGQEQTARELPWYRAWLRSTGRTGDFLDEVTAERGPDFPAKVSDALGGRSAKRHRWPSHERPSGAGPHWSPCRYEDRCLDCGALYRATPRPPCRLSGAES